MSFFGTPAGWLTLLLGALAALAAAFWQGMEFEQGIVAKERLKAEQDFTKRLSEAIEAERAITAKVAADLQKERDARSADQRRFNKKLAEVPRETLVEVCTAGSAPLAEQRAARSEAPMPPAAFVPRLTARTCELWNDALAAGATAAERAGWLTGANPCADGAAAR